MNSKTTITGTDGNPYEITQDMVQIFMKTEKINGKHLHELLLLFDFRKTHAPLIPLQGYAKKIALCTME